MTISLTNRVGTGRSALIFYPTLRTSSERTFWSTFCTQLRERGYDPIAVSFLRPADDYPVNAERFYVPIWQSIERTPGFAGYGNEFSYFLRLFLSSPVRKAGFEALLEMGAAPYSYSKGFTLSDIKCSYPWFAEIRRSALIYIEYTLTIIQRLQPALIVVNNDTHPLHLLARMAADALDIPAVHSERSPNVNQWFEPIGYYQDSKIADFMADGRWRQPGSHEQRGRELIGQIRAAPAGHRANGDAQQAFKKNSLRPRIFLPLDHALATGWSLPSHPLRLHNYPLLSTPESAIDYFASLAERLGVELWVKAHPSENCDATFIKQARRDPRVTFINDGFEEALQTADVVVGFLTKTACTALALDKAVVTVGPNMAAVSGLTYHCKRVDEIETRVREALEGGSKPDQSSLTARFLGYLDVNFFIANDLSNPGAKALLERLCPQLPKAQRAKAAPIAVTLAELDALAPEAPVFDRKGLVAGPYARPENRRIEEVHLVEALFGKGVVPLRGPSPVMFDVGACIGDAHKWFANEGWEVHAFEPNPPMHERITNTLAPGVTLNQLAVSDKSGEKVDFFTSEESIGISSMLAFRDTHKATATVETIRLDDYCAAKRVSHIDFLKVDTEGFDLFVVKSLNWDTHAPSVVICEFEDNKTRALDYTFGDLVSFLADRGYQIFVSEWHPITRYGAGEHRWRAMHHWPCELFDANAWGNLIAFQKPLSESMMRSLTTLLTGFDFTDRANKGKLKIGSMALPVPISYGATAPPDAEGYFRAPPPASQNWLGAHLPVAISAGDKVLAQISVQSAEPARLRLWVGRFGQKTPLEGTKQVVTAEAGLNRFDVEAGFKHGHDGLLIQVGAAGEAPVRIGALDCTVNKIGAAPDVAAITARLDKANGPVLTYFPPIDSEAALIDTMARAAWFLSFPKLGRILVPVTEPALSHTAWRVPTGMDPAVADRFAALREQVEFAVCADGMAAQPLLEKSDGVLCWRSADCASLFEAEQAKVDWLKGKRLWRVDPNTDRNEGALYIEVGFRNMPDHDELIARNKARFDTFARRIGKRERAYVLATGPSADQYRTLNHQGAFGVVCNSVILDDELMQILKPHVLVFADPIFHFGPSEYAAAFRQNVRDAAQKYDFIIAIPLKYHDIFIDQLPELASRMIAIPFAVKPEFSFDLSAQFDVKVTANILTFLMLPLAASFGNTIEILGCDGRPLSENTYFWNHNRNTQINDKMANIRGVHPGFFAIDYNDYYTKHCELLEQQLNEGEVQGRRFLCVAHSHIPALGKRMPRDFKPRCQQAQPARRPRVLVIDSTKIGSLTATGQVKKAFLRGWEPADVVQIYSGGGGDLFLSRPLVGGGDGRLKGYDDLFLKVADFRPDVMYYRPVEQRPELDEVAWKLINRYDLPVVSHIMDDWPALVAERDPKRAARLDAGLRELFRRSHSALSISQRMSEAFSLRYGIDFTPLANGVDPTVTEEALEAAKPVKASRDEVVLRYTGALAPNMTLNAIADIARAVDSLQGGLPVRLEVYTMAQWREGFDAAIKGLSGVSVLDSVPDDQYPALLAEADILVLGYNFDSTSLSYIGYSLPNKLPEYLASGAAVLAYGPRETAAMDLLTTHDLAVCVNEPDLNALREAIRGLAVNKDTRIVLAKRAREWVVDQRDINRIADSFARILTSAAGSVRRESAPCAREDHVGVDETAVVSRLMQERCGRNHVIIDVGAHVGSSAAYFDKLGWTIHCFEPDPANREKLTARFGQSENVSIDSRALSDAPAKGVSFFTSEESTGISGLHAFRDTHAVTGTVDVTTLKDVAVANGLKHVDFLKIDVEGFDLSVLRGVPWDSLAPDAIEAEFEDAKTLSLGHTYRDICDYLLERDYAVYLSEWHPIIRYGVAHDWRGIKRYPCELATPEAWGNILAFRRDPGFEAVETAFQACLKYRPPLPEATKNTCLDKSAQQGRPCLRVANKLAREGEYRLALEHYLLLWERAGPTDKVVARSYEFNALYVARKLGMKGNSTMQEVSEFLHSGD